jgi:hypothetical protein
MDDVDGMDENGRTTRENFGSLSIVVHGVHQRPSFSKP